MNDELDPNIKALLTAERAREDAPSDEARRRLVTSLAAAMSPGIAAPTTTGAGSPAPRLARSVSIARASVMAGITFVAGAAAGAAFMAMRSPLVTAVVPTFVPAEAGLVATAGTADAAVDDAATPFDASVDLADADADADAGASLQRARPAHEAATDLAAERALLDQARDATQHHDPTRALRLLADHAARFPHGQLAEEREALAVEALVESGQYERARARAEKLRVRAPHSLVLPAVDATLQSIP